MEIYPVLLGSIREAEDPSIFRIYCPPLRPIRSGSLSRRSSWLNDVLPVKREAVLVGSPALSAKSGKHNRLITEGFDFIGSTYSAARNYDCYRQLQHIVLPFFRTSLLPYFGGDDNRKRLSTIHTEGVFSFNLVAQVISGRD